MPRTLWARLLLAVAVLLIAYLLLAPVAIEPVAWSAPRPPPPTGPWAPNDRLRWVEWVGKGTVDGPEAVAVDGLGRVYAGTRDGRIVRLESGGRTFETVARTGGRPLGLAFGADGTLYVADAAKGLLALSPGGKLRVLATGHGDAPFGFTDDVDVGPDGTVYFTDASSRFGLAQFREDIVEHGGHGRLLAWRPATGRTELLLSGLNFANGVAVHGSGEWLVVNETGSYRMVRHWLAGPRRGQSEPFLENLPAFPDNVTWSRDRKAFWVALFSPRVAVLDLLAPWPLGRKVLLRLPRLLQPEPARHGWALAVDERGQVMASLQDLSPGGFAPVTSVREVGGVLWLGSLERDAVGRIAAPSLPR